MRVYFYHTQNIQYCLNKMQKGEFPAHFLYGACHLADSGIDVVWHRSPQKEMSRLRTALYTAWQVLTCRKRFDAIYAVHYKGLELVILLRALHLIGTPIVVWHHQPIITPMSKWREWGGRLFYRGMDRLIFFSKKLVNDSLTSPKADSERMVVGHWGADLDFYDRIINSTSNEHKDKEMVFIATGKEQRDQKTLIEAFNATGKHLELYIGINPNPKVDNPNLNAIRSCKPKANIRVVEVCGLLPYEIAKEVAKANCVVICCKPTRYTAGLTTVVEALALGLPVICSRNPQIPIDFDKERCGIAVDYGDVKGWEKAINFIATHPEEAKRMGQRGRQIAEERFNDILNAKEMANVIREVVEK